MVILSDDENHANTDFARKTSEITIEQPKSNCFKNGTDTAVNGDKNTFEVFLDLCTTKVENVKHKELLLEKTSTIKLLYKRAGDYVTTKEFNDSLAHQLKLLDGQPKFTLHCFNIIFQQLKHAWKNKDKDKEVDENKLRLRKKVQKKLDLLHKKIRRLENEELSLTDLDDEDSSYIQLQR